MEHCLKCSFNHSISLFVACIFSVCNLFSQPKFLPSNGKTLLIIGQDLGAVGSFDSPNNNGYLDHIKITPAGITTYTSLNNLQGLKTLVNYGAGDVCGQCIIANPIFDSTILVIGLYMVNQLDNINNGSFDNQINELGNWIKSTDRPVFLRIGYEFDGPWNNYDKVKYKISFRHIVDHFRSLQVNNCAYVWQACGYDYGDQMQWYPGDDYVDWFAYSHFSSNCNGVRMPDSARTHHKPLMIAEATPRGFNVSSQSSATCWNNWFKPFFNFIHANQDVIKAVAYINVNWDSQSMWAGQGWGDSRVQANDSILSLWKAEIQTDFWINSSSKLFCIVNYSTCDSAQKINEIKPDEIELFPNPSSDGCIHIKGVENFPGEIIITVYTLTGELIFHQLISERKEINTILTVNTGISIQGTYLVKISSGQHTYIKRIFFN